MCTCAYVYALTRDQFRQINILQSWEKGKIANPPNAPVVNISCYTVYGTLNVIMNMQNIAFIFPFCENDNFAKL